MSASPRPARRTLSQAILSLEAGAALFSAAAVFGLDRAGRLSADPAWVWGIGAGLAVALILGARLQKYRWGIALGWALQVPLLAAGFVSLPIAAVGGMFVLLWVGALRLGGRIDRERAERAGIEEAVNEGTT